jgi:hypothetical protein
MAVLIEQLQLRPNLFGGKMKVIFRKCSSYYKVGRLLHLISFLFTIFFLFTLWEFLQAEEQSFFAQIGLTFLILFLFANAILAELDARSRFQNYKQLKDQLYFNGYSERILKPMLKSMCQRDAALVAAEELGMAHACTIYFKKHGYRWYHFIPDFVFSHPLFLLSKYFWTSTFFTPTYYPKVNSYDLPFTSLEQATSSTR